LIAQAGSKYDPNMTVVKAKGLRNKAEEIPEDPSSRTKKITEEEFINTGDDDQEKDVDLVQEENIPVSPAEKKFKLPDNTGKLHQLIQIVNTYPGDEKIYIGEKVFSLSEEGM
jgi:hypothetical protein